MSWKFTRRRLRIVLDGNTLGMEKEVLVSRVEAYKTKSGNTRFVLSRRGRERVHDVQGGDRAAGGGSGGPASADRVPRAAAERVHERATSIASSRSRRREDGNEHREHGRGRLEVAGRKPRPWLVGTAEPDRADPSEGALRPAEAVPGRGRQTDIRRDGEESTRSGRVRCLAPDMARMATAHAARVRSRNPPRYCVRRRNSRVPAGRSGTGHGWGR